MKIIRLKNKIQEVDHCDNCPFAEYEDYDYSYLCNLSEKRIAYANEKFDIPEWCELEEKE